MLLVSISACQNSDVVQTSTEREILSSQPTESPTSLPSSQATPLLTTTPSVVSQSPSQLPPQSQKRVATIQNSPTSNQRTCQLSAYVTDKDPNGTNVRASPSNTAQIIKTLPTNTLAVIVTLTAAQGDWLKLTKAQGVEEIEFQGNGWIYAPLLGTSTRGYANKSVPVYANANTQNTAIGRIPSQRGVKLLSCDRNWALVEYQGLKGWIEPESQCANPLTTCP